MTGRGRLTALLTWSLFAAVYAMPITMSAADPVDENPVVVFDLSEEYEYLPPAGTGASITANSPTPINLTGAGNDLTVTVEAADPAELLTRAFAIQTPGPAGPVPFRRVNLGIFEAVLVPGGLLVCTAITATGAEVQVIEAEVAQNAPVVIR